MYEMTVITLQCTCTTFRDYKYMGLVYINLITLCIAIIL